MPAVVPTASGRRKPVGTPQKRQEKGNFYKAKSRRADKLFNKNRLCRTIKLILQPNLRANQLIIHENKIHPT
jgi:hypothetical protein